MRELFGKYPSLLSERKGWFSYRTILWIFCLTYFITERSPWHWSNDVIPDYRLRRVDCSLESCAASSGLASGGFRASDSPHSPTLTLSPSLSSHSRFSTVGCCSKAASWRQDAWLPRWLRMLLQDPRENQEVVTSLRGELFSPPLLLCCISAALDHERTIRSNAERSECVSVAGGDVLCLCVHLRLRLKCCMGKSRSNAGFSLKWPN